MKTSTGMVQALAEWGHEMGAMIMAIGIVMSIVGVGNALTLEPASAIHQIYVILNVLVAATGMVVFALGLIAQRIQSLIDQGKETPAAQAPAESSRRREPSLRSPS